MGILFDSSQNLLSDKLVQEYLAIPRDKRFDPKPGTIESFIPNNCYTHLPVDLKQKLLDYQNAVRKLHDLPAADIVTGWIVEYNVGDCYPFHKDVVHRTVHDREGRLMLGSVVLLVDPSSFEGGHLLFDVCEDYQKINFTRRGHGIIFDGNVWKHSVTNIKKGTRVAIVSWAS